MASQYNAGARISKWKIIWAIASKDFVDGLKRRQMLSSILTIIFLLALYRFLPLLGNANSPPLLVVFDSGESGLMQDLELSEAVQLRTAESYEDMLYEVGTEDRNTTGLVLPADFDPRAGSGEAIELEAYIDHWVDRDDEASMKTVIEDEIARLSGAPVNLRVEREYLTQLDSGFSFYIAFGLLVVMWMMGMMVTPLLIVEEKTNRTIDALRVSPITEAELLTAKVLVGAVYCVMMSSVVLVAYGSFVLHWWAMVGAILCGTFFIVSIGLLLGIKINDPRQISLWTFIIFQPLLITMILGIFEAVSPGLRAAMRWLPTVAMGNAAAQSIAFNVDLTAYLQSLVIMIVWSLAFFLFDAWLLRRMEQ
jgi:ABC-type Na+ efflux pump permease subunit